MSERAVFLDRDNTIIEEVGDGYLGDPAKVKLLPGAAAAIAAMRRLGYRMIVASNQSGVGRGIFGEEAVEAVNQEMCRQLREQAAAHIDASYYCPYHPEATVPEYRMEHEWRKPKAGMLRQAAEDFHLDLAQCWMIGDMPRDITAGAAAGCRTILLRDPERPAPENASNALAVSPNFIVKTLADAARIVAREAKNPHPDLVPAPLTSGAGAVGEVARPAVMDEEALAEKISRRVAKSVPQPEALRPVLLDIATQLRQQSHLRDIARNVAEFSAARMLGVAAQILALACLAIGVIGAISAGRQDAGGQMFGVHVIGLLHAGLWLLGGVIFQGLALTLHIQRRK